MKYKWSSSSSLSINIWKEDMVIYNHLSGDTHFYTNSVKRIVQESLNLGEFDLPELIECCCASSNEIHEAEAQIKSMVLELSRNDLVSAE